MVAEFIGNSLGGGLKVAVFLGDSTSGQINEIQIIFLSASSIVQMFSLKFIFIPTLGVQVVLP